LKILTLDIETAPLRGMFWRIWKENIGINQLTNDWYMLCYCAKWLDSEEVLWDSVYNHGTPEDDKGVLESLRELLCEADIVVTHNGNSFDLPKIQTRMLLNDLDPPSPYRSIDTLAIAKKEFGFTSNKLAFIAQSLGLGDKLDTGGFELWDRCLAWDGEAWEDMVEYCGHDVWLTEQVYLKFRPWHRSHPNLALYVDDDNPVCPVCGGDQLTRNGTRTVKTNMSKFTEWHCKDCGAYRRGRKNLADRTNLLANVGS
jgi:hypothetical protein